MSRMLIRSAGATVGLLGLVSACSPLPETGQVGVTLGAPTTDQESLPLIIDTTATIDGEFSLVESPCDPSNVVTDDDLADHFLYPILPQWDPYDCMTEDGVATENEGNIQVSIDGFFLGYYTSENVTIDVSPKIQFAVYDSAVYDGDGDPETTEDQEERLVFLCNFYYPADNLGYAEMVYNTYMKYTAEDLYGVPLYALDDNGQPTVVMDPQPGLIDGFGAVNAPWLYFSYQGMYNQFYAFTDEFSEDLKDEWIAEPLVNQHVFMATLHHTNHAAYYGADFERVITGGFDLTQMPADWCGHAPYNLEPLHDIFGLY